MKNKYLVQLYLLVKRQLKNIAFTAFLIGMPIVVMIIINIPQMGENSVPKVGIIALDNDSLVDRTIERLEKDSYALDFYVAESQEELVEDVQSGKTECGYIFSEGISDKIQNGKYKNSILCINNTSQMLHSLANEVVFSSFFKVYAKDILVNFVDSEEIFANVSDKQLAELADNYDKYLDGAATFHIDFKTLENNQLDSELVDIELQTTYFPLRGILAILVYVAGISGAVTWIKDRKNGLRINRGVSIAIPTVLFAISSLVTIYVAGINYDFITELKAMLILMAGVVIFAVALTYIIKDEVVMASLIPILAIASIVFCPVFIDIADYLPMAKYINKLLVPYYYLQWF